MRFYKFGAFDSELHLIHVKFEIIPPNRWMGNEKPGPLASAEEKKSEDVLDEPEAKRVKRRAASAKTGENDAGTRTYL